MSEPPGGAATNGVVGDSVSELHTSPAVGTVVIIGNGMVGHRLCDRLSQPAAGACRPRVVVLGEESRPAYDRMRLGEMLRGRRATSLTLASPEWYRERNIELVLDDPVVKVDRTARVARTRRGRTFSYDQLVFATGAAPVIPKMDIAEGADVFAIRTTRDIERLRDRSKVARTAAVLGGGLLGLETARSLRDAGIDVTVVEAGPSLMARQLDDEAADLLKGKLESTGLKIALSARVERIVARRSLASASASASQQIVFSADSDRPPLDVDFVVISVGVEPRDVLAGAWGVSLGLGGGIAVDDHLRTADPHVYAIGDCAALDGVTYGLVAPGYRMAEALAATLLGTPTAFEVPVAPVHLKVAGVEVVTVGQTRRRPSHKTFRFRRDDVYRRVVVEDGHVVGVTSVGGWAELGAVQEAIASERDLTQTWYERFTRGENLWRGDGAVSVRADSEVVCVCANVTAGAIRDAITGGCQTADQVSFATGAARGCGSCLPLVSLMVGSRAPVRRGPRRWLAGFATAVLGGLAVALVASPAAFTTLLEQYRVDALFRDPFWQQVSGFTLLGTCAMAMLLPLGKRALRVSGTALPAWRAAHAGIGLAALGAVIVHTSLRRGHHLNLALETAFVVLLFLGAGAGLSGLKQGGVIGRVLRLAHLVVFWPLLALIGLHVLAVYYF